MFEEFGDGTEIIWDGCFAKYDIWATLSNEAGPSRKNDDYMDLFLHLLEKKKDSRDHWK